jgi:hypothetical protein
MSRCQRQGYTNVERGNAPKFSPKIRQRGKPMTGDGRI